MPRRSAGRTRPLALAIKRKPVIKKSRATTVVAAQAGMTTEVRAEPGGADATGGCEERFFNKEIAKISKRGI